MAYNHGLGIVDDTSEFIETSNLNAFSKTCNRFTQCNESGDVFIEHIVKSEANNIVTEAYPPGNNLVQLWS